MMARPRTDTRERLLADTMFYVAMHGVGTLNLRDLAAAIGTSHRMLIFHFGSKDGLLADITRVTRAQHRDLLREAARATAATPGEQVRGMWRHLTDLAHAPGLRLFLELYGQAIQGRPYAADLLAGLTDDWRDPLAEALERTGLAAPRARQDAYLAATVIRGLLLDRLAGGDTAGTDAAFDHFVADLTSRH
jgi:AcrR family transcriptional regulator